MQKDCLFAIGEALIDFIPDRANCAFGDVEAFSPKVGGAPANVCGAFAKLGGRAKMLTQLGDDPFGHKILDYLARWNIDTSCIKLTDKANTALAFVSIASDGDRTFSFYRKPSADMLYSAQDVSSVDFGDAYALHFCSVSLGDFPMKDAHVRAIDAVRAAGGIVSFDPNLRFPLWDDREALRDTVRAFLPKADVVKISDEELEFITGTDNIEDALPDLWRGGAKLVLYTCGKDGAWAFTQNAQAHSPGVRVTAVDTTGAGDGFIGAFLWTLRRFGVGRDDLSALRDGTLQTCVDFANAFCAKSVQKPGAIDSYPTADEL